MEVINNLYIIGAGFDHVLFKTPLNEGLLCLLINTIEDQALREKVKEQQKKYNTNDIEIFLTLVDLKIQLTEDESNTIRKAIEDSICKYFQQYRFSEKIINENEWVQVFAKEILQRNDMIIDLNYDMFLGGVLDYYDRWTPYGGYSSHLAHFNLADDIVKNKDINNITIYKIHGAEGIDEHSITNKPLYTYLGYEINPTLFPKTGANSHLKCGFDEYRKVAGSIVAPTYIKKPHPHLEAMWGEVIYKAAHAKNLIIMGCGIRSEDVILQLALNRFLLADINNLRNKKLIIINGGAGSEETYGRLASRFYDISNFFAAEGFCFKLGSLNETAMEKLKKIIIT